VQPESFNTLQQTNPFICYFEAHLSKKTCSCHQQKQQQQQEQEEEEE
jgi:hypothetical protein